MDAQSGFVYVSLFKIRYETSSVVFFQGNFGPSFQWQKVYCIPNSDRKFPNAEVKKTCKKSINKLYSYFLKIHDLL